MQQNNHFLVSFLHICTILMKTTTRRNLSLMSELKRTENWTLTHTHTNTHTHTLEDNFPTLFQGQQPYLIYRVIYNQLKPRPPPAPWPPWAPPPNSCTPRPLLLQDFLKKKEKDTQGVCFPAVVLNWDSNWLGWRCSVAGTVWSGWVFPLWSRSALCLSAVMVAPRERDCKSQHLLLLVNLKENTVFQKKKNKKKKRRTWHYPF